MRSSFFGLSVGTQGLYTAATALDITNHNITNAETEGYSRQYGVQTTNSPLANTTRGMIGTGSTIEDVGQYRSEYLDYKYWSTNEVLGTYTVKADMLEQMELIFNEPTDVGFTSYFDDVFDALQDVSKNPSDEATRSNYISSLSSFTSYLNDISTQLQDLQDEANFGVKNSVQQINYIAEQIASVNQQINNIEITGVSANDLRDQRALLIDELSGIVGVDVSVNEDVNGVETMDISINGQQLVHGSSYNTLETRVRDYKDNPEDSNDIYDIYWSSGKRFYTENENLTGELKGYLDIRDGNNTNNFTGDIVGGAGTNEITLNNLSRTDIDETGAITIDGVDYEYTIVSYDDATGEMVVNLGTETCPVDAEDCSMGTSIAFKGIPYYLEQLNEFARTIAQEFNTLQESGDDNSGLPLFTYEGYTGSPALDTSSDYSYNQITVDTLQVNPDIVDDVSLLKTKYSESDGESSNDLILDMIELRHDDEMFSKGVPDNFMQAIISELGIDSKQYASFQAGQEELSQLITNQRLSISDVDLDEEATNLVKYQQAYSMAAKIISVFDEIYDVTINQMGL